MVLHKAVGWHEERQSLLYSNYLGIVQRGIYSFIFAHINKTKHYILPMSLYHLFPWESMAIFPWELCNNCLTHKCLHAVCSVVLIQAKLVTKAIPLKQECSAPQRLEDKTLFPWTSHTSYCLSRNPQGR